MRAAVFADQAGEANAVNRNFFRVGAELPVPCCPLRIRRSPGRVLLVYEKAGRADRFADRLIDEHEAAVRNGFPESLSELIRERRIGFHRDHAISELQVKVGVLSFVRADIKNQVFIRDLSHSHRCPFSSVQRELLSSGSYHHLTRHQQQTSRTLFWAFK